MSEATKGNDVIFDFDGANVINGSKGDDRLSGNAGDDILNGEAGDDILRGGNGNDVLDGGQGEDTLNGGNGDDILTGGIGADRLIGGSGNDIFRFGDRAIEDSANGIYDDIVDFVQGQDKLSVKGFSLEDTIITYGANNLVNLDLDGNGTTDLSFISANKVNFTSNDFTDYTGV